MIAFIILTWVYPLSRYVQFLCGKSAVRCGTIYELNYVSGFYFVFHPKIIPALIDCLHSRDFESLLVMARMGDVGALDEKPAHFYKLYILSFIFCDPFDAHYCAVCRLVEDGVPTSIICVPIDYFHPRHNMMTKIEE